MIDDVYCKWVDARIPQSETNSSCHQYFIYTSADTYLCMHCDRSPMLDLGTPVDKLLENLK